MLSFRYTKQTSKNIAGITFKIRDFERGLLRSLKKVNFIFTFKPSPV